jgi:GxxExxY protein
MNPHLNELTHVVVGAAIEVHRHLGPGLLESSYKECLCRELQIRGVKFLREYSLPLEYKGMRLDCGYRIDVVVEELVPVELKAVQALMPVHEA